MCAYVLWHDRQKMLLFDMLYLYFNKFIAPKSQDAPYAGDYLKLCYSSTF